MAKLQLLPSNKLLLLGGKLMIDCCCDEVVDCCDTPGGPPTASFLYGVAGPGSPCTINLLDQSVAGTCGSISSWQWFKNGVAFSTAQNPSVSVATGDSICLTVTDSYGCTDTFCRIIDCDRFTTCCPYDYHLLPFNITLTIPSTMIVDNPDGVCPACEGLDGAQTLSNYAPCGWRKIIGSINTCPGRTTYTVTANSTLIAASIQLNSFSGGYTREWRLTKSSPPGLCRGTWSLPWFNDTSSGGGHAWCEFTALPSSNATVTIA